MTQNILPLSTQTKVFSAPDPFAALRDGLINNAESRNTLQFCPVCNSRISDRKIAIYEELIQDLYKIYCWCGKNKRHEFSMKDIRNMLSRNNYARFGDLVRFGGLVYKFSEDGRHIRAQYGLNMARCREFFYNRLAIPVQITINQITNEIIDRKLLVVCQFPKLREFLDTNNIYDYERDI
jgi:hypothetical protein